MSIADEMDKLRSDIEVTNAEILLNAREAEFHSNLVLKNVRQLEGYRLRLRELVKAQYEAEQDDYSLDRPI